MNKGSKSITLPQRKERYITNNIRLFVKIQGGAATPDGGFRFLSRTTDNVVKSVSII